MVERGTGNEERGKAIGGALDVERVEVAYGATRVLKGISLSIAPGEFVALLGSSGCGKTTLLRAISGFVPVSSGVVRADGRDVTHAAPDRRDMAMVFQTYALWPHMSAAQNIGYGLRVRGWDRARIAASCPRAWCR
jgi:ABC-type sugar transport system ATPase subunit